MVAVSGGIDSMALLDMLAHMPGLDVVVAHFEHGIREDSDADRELVGRAAKRYGLPFIYEHGNLGAGASEAQARTARYDFLYRVKEQANADAIITAHHQDDLIETAIINILRGTGRKGLSSLRSTDDILRPLLATPKHDLYSYVSSHPEHDIIWNTDSTNKSDVYLRNYIRHHLIKGLGEAGRELLLSYVEQASETNPLIDSLLLHDINANTNEQGLDRQWFIMQPYDVSCEIMAAWLRAHTIREFDRKLIGRLVIAAKTDMAGKTRDINAGYLLKVNKAHVQVVQRSPS